LKEIGNSNWESLNIGAKNTYLFTALPSGYRDQNGKFGQQGKESRFWEVDGNGVYASGCILLQNNTRVTTIGYPDNRYGFSIRCIKD
jgi:uncharacterized protein (TIGR02145 family)